MKQFFFNILLFITPLIVGYLWLEYKLSLLPNSYNQKKNGIAKHLNDAEVLVLGSSAQLHGINPELLSAKTYNMANVTQPIYYDTRLVEYYYPKMPKLKVVIFGVYYCAFYRELADMEENWRMYFYYYYWGFNVQKGSVFDLQKYSLTAIYSPFTAFGYIRRNFKVDAAPTFSEYGFISHDSIGHLNVLNDANGKERVKYHNHGYTKDNIEHVFGYLDQTINDLTKNNIKVILITLPVFHTYSDNFRPDIDSCNRKLIDSLVTKYNCKYYDFLKDKRFTIDDFYDNDHLDSFGAVKFSKILDSEVIRPFFKK